MIYTERNEFMNKTNKKCLRLIKNYNNMNMKEQNKKQQN